MIWLHPTVYRMIKVYSNMHVSEVPYKCNFAGPVTLFSIFQQSYITVSFLQELQ